ncbi:FAD-dependent monooxygenase fsr3 [Colletotrichum fructicola]|uniref:FAD-dependent monooxygenase fsr3 n=1 Tax=Colletotrichum fructicola (strain Nara gc5) TaxID=1213859 RepID=A0A7J6JE29_COLFN|nr:FAD-dependent monooxygenase fsr3 [Colletotrichum fructicola Nara gc5]KAF4886314.1 FAD-dependent monooxygenase fsr3 [Colletotrichum fructicola]KAF4899962.1 FAD-dependent monooxygenase fsr3 [Colletotrichum fructicola]KAF4937037.1 FAD-dependent monooxygenase fsr3 [Colletotrichum fructicola]KAF5503218.1 FAD-dependent monooxygenase fsr3 [Colletotrichum fructicola]
MTVKSFDAPEPTHESVVVDGVLQWPSTGINVLVVGGGPAGYLTALECWRKGHNVSILEKSEQNSTIGDVLFIGPSAWTTLKYYPTLLKDYHDHSWDNFCSFRRLDGSLIAPPQEFEYNRSDVPHHAAWPLRVRGMVSRPGLNEIFYQQCRRLGIPVTFGVNIIDYTEDSNSGVASAIADDGRTFTADVVVAADGLGTKSHKAVMGEVIRAVSTGFVICRIFYRLDPEKNTALYQKLAALKRPDMRAYSGDTFHCVVTAASDGIVVGVTMPDDGTAQESWSETITSEDFIKQLPKASDTEHWDPLIIEAIQNIPEDSIVKWKLCWRDPQTKWTSPGGRIIQLGDSAHAFIPSSTSGATTALEDAQSLPECLRLAGKANVDIGTKIHELLRLRRASILQRLGHENRREMHRFGGMEEVMKHAPPGGPMGLGKWIWTHNAEEYATKKFAEARAHLESGAPFEHKNLPEGHKWEPWSMQEELEKEKQGINTPELKLNGDWGIY